MVKKKGSLTINEPNMILKFKCECYFKETFTAFIPFCPS